MSPSLPAPRRGSGQGRRLRDHSIVGASWPDVSQFAAGMNHPGGTSTIGKAAPDCPFMMPSLAMVGGGRREGSGDAGPGGGE